jgi:L-iditol 2-dehydrogenase
MRCAVAYSFDDIRVETRPVPAIGPAEALIRVDAASLCTGDVTRWYIDRKAAGSGGSTVLGHEAMGTIVALGPDAPGRFALGQRIVPHHHAPCLRDDCPACARGEYVQCPTWKATGFDPGGMAEYMRVEATCLANDTQIVPDDVPDEDAAITEPTACCVKAMTKRANLRPGGSVVIIGVGVMGMINLLLARHLGAGTIIAVDLIDWRLNKAREFGADHTIHAGHEDAVARVRELTGGRGADTVIVGPPAVRAQQSGLAMAAPAGTVCFFMTTDPGETLTVTPFDLYFAELTLTHSYSCGPDDMREALSLIRAGVVTAGKVITHRAPLSDFPAAYRAAAVPGENLKTMIGIDRTG